MSLRNICDWCFEPFNSKPIKIHTIDSNVVDLKSCSEECFEQIVLDYMQEKEGCVDSAGRYQEKMLENNH